MQNAPKKSASVLSYLGDKTRMLPQLRLILPEFQTHTEAYGGMGAMTRSLLQTTDGKQLVWNEINRDNINLFKTIRDQPAELAAAMKVTANDPSFYFYAVKYFQSKRADNVSRAAMYLVVQNNGIHTHQKPRYNSGFIHKQRFGNLHTWVETYAALFKNLTIEEIDAIELIQKYDGEDTLHFLDPPYVLKTRKRHDTRYTHEMCDADHHKLCETLLQCKGKVILCGYPTAIYDEHLQGWDKVGPLNRYPKIPIDICDKRLVEIYNKNVAKWKPEMVWTNFKIDDRTKEMIRRRANRID